VKLTPYTRIQNGLFISIPDVKVYECDVCGYEEVDDVVLMQLDTLIDDFSAVEPSNRSATKLPSVDADTLDGAAPPPRLK